MKRIKATDLTISIVKDMIGLPKYVKSNECGKWYNLSYVPMGFKINTTYEFMYMWTLSIYDDTIIGYTWPELEHAFEVIQEAYNLPKHGEDTEVYTVFPIYVHNFAQFEWHFIKSNLNVTDKLLLGNETDKDGNQLEPDALFCTVNNSFLFVDSYKICPMKIEDLAEAYCNTKLPKKPEQREINTTMAKQFSDEELNYYCNYTIILAEFAEFMEDHVLSYSHLPVTQNQIVSDSIKAAYKDDKLSADAVKDLFPDKWQYILLRRWGLRGGACITTDRWEKAEIKCHDLNSAYCAAAVHGYFPISKYKRATNVENYKYYLKNYCCQIRVTFHNLRLKHKWLPYESTNMCIEASEFDNIEVNRSGKIIYAPNLTVSINEIDFKLYSILYTCDSMTIHEIQYAKRGRLPNPLIKVFLKYYGDKAELKLHGKKDTPEYKRAKIMPSTISGFMSKKISGLDIKEIDKINYGKWKQLTGGKKVMPQWGVYITAHVRYWIYSTIIQIGKLNYLYTDTDSIYNISDERTDKVFEVFNKYMRSLNKNMCEKYNLNYEVYKDLGTFEEDGEIDEFKTIGTKAYVYHKKYSPKAPILKNGKCQNYKLVLAGMPEEDFWNSYIEWHQHNKDKSVFDYFEDDSEITYYKKENNVVHHTSKMINGEYMYCAGGMRVDKYPITTTIRTSKIINTYITAVNKDIDTRG